MAVALYLNKQFYAPDYLVNLVATSGISTAIEVKNLTKDYEGKRVLDGLSFRLKEGECLAIVGENGSGKSTLINSLADILKPSGGEMLFFGKKYNLPESKRLRGIVFQENRFDGLFSGKEVLEFQGMFYGLGRQKIEENSRVLLRLVDLVDASKKQVLTYSAGMKKRLEIAKALMGEPKILLLDEPTSELDANIKQKIRDYIKQAKDRFRLTVLLATHDLMEALKISNRIIVLDKKILLEIDTTELREIKTVLIIKSKDSDRIKDKMPPGWKAKKLDEDTMMILADEEKEKIQAKIISAFKNMEIQKIEMHDFDLADLFRWSGIK